VDGARQPHLIPHFDTALLHRSAGPADHGARRRQRHSRLHQDRLVGKRNLVVRLGRARVALYLALAGGELASCRWASRRLFPSVPRRVLAVPLIVAGACAVANYGRQALPAGDAPHGHRYAATAAAGLLAARGPA
jgi:hypothetical protein